MSVTLPRIMLMACLLSPAMSYALGLGEIHLNSSLNEPMNADIDLLAAAPEELSALRATLAGREAFTRYGIDRPNFLTSLTFKVGKSKDGRDALLVRSSEAIPEPFVTFLVEVNWARGRLMREYTVLLDPPVYTPGERASSAAPVAAASSGAGESVRRPAPAPAQPSIATPNNARLSRSSGASSTPASSDSSAASGGNTYRVAQGDTLTKIAHSLRTQSAANVDQTMIAIYRANPEAFGGNINVLKRGAVLRVPGADDVAALNQSEAMSEVHRQMNAWRGAAGADSGGHLRLVTPGAGGGTGSAGGDGSGATVDNGALKDKVRDLEGQLAESKRLLEIRNNELAQLQKKLGTTPAPVASTPTPAPPAPVVKPVPTPPVSAKPVPVPVPVPAPVVSTPTPTPAASAPEPAASSAGSAVESAPAASAPVKKPDVAPVESTSWIDWVSANWWIPAAILLALVGGIGFAAWRRRQNAAGDFPSLDSTDVSDFHDPTAKLGSNRRGNESFVVEESGEHPQPEFGAAPEQFGEITSDLKSPDDTMSSEAAVNLDQGDPLAEADFHMAYGLYDQAADLVRIALEREPDRRDLRLKLLEIYFVWGNKDQFLQTAKQLETTRDRAAAGEWDKIVIMGKQIAPEDPLFSASGSGRGAGALVDLNLEGGENRVDIDLFGEPEGEHSNDHAVANNSDVASTGESPHMRGSSDLDFTLDAPERGADDSPTREMPPRDEPTVESELMNFSESPTQESPAMRTAEMRDRISSKVPKTDQTAEVSIDDLGLNLDDLDDTASSVDIPHLEETDHPSDAPTMVAGLDEKSRRLMSEAESRSRDKDLTELERELEASFIADLEPDAEESKTAVLGPESAPTLQMPRHTEFDGSATSRFKSPEFSDIGEADRGDIDSTSKLRGLSADSVDLDLDRLASALGSGDTVQQPRAEDEIFSTEVFESSGNADDIDLDVGDALNGSQEPTNKLQALQQQTRANTMKNEELALPELEPVTMSEVGTKLDLARAYMDMGDPEGARSILEEVVNEGSASQKQEAQRLIEALPG